MESNRVAKMIINTNGVVDRTISVRFDRLVYCATVFFDSLYNFNAGKTITKLIPVRKSGINTIHNILTSSLPA